MSRRLALAAVALLALAWAGAGLAVYRVTQSAARPQPAHSPHPVARSETERMPLDAWAEDPPELLILFTGQQLGRLKPCGCSPAFQKGGLAKRGAFFRYAREKGWPTVALDLGGLVDNPEQSYGLLKYIAGPEHRLAKLEISLQALRLLGYDAMGLGPQDVNLEAGLLTYVSAVADAEGPTPLNCNLSMPEDLRSTVRPYLVLERAGLKIGVLAAIGPRYAQVVKDELTPLKWQAPEEVLSQWLTAIEPCDLKILLFYGTLDAARKLTERYPVFDLVIHAEGSEEPSGREIWHQETLFVTVGQKGKYAGAVGLWSKGDRRLAFELVPLDHRFPDDPKLKQLVYGDYLAKLAGLRLVEKIVQKPLPEGQTIAGVQACASCHPRVVEKWQQSKHAKALEALKRTGEHVNPECLACHTTMFGYRGGYDGTPATAHLGGNQCENCHGPAGAHVRDPENVVFRQALHLESVSAEAKLCKRCHDAENDPQFRFAQRWADIVHTEEARRDALEYRRKRRK